MTTPTTPAGGQRSSDAADGDEYLEQLARATIGKGRPRKYDWLNWLDGERHTLARGRDFEIDALSLQKQAQTEARKRRVKIRTKRATDENGVEWLLIDGRELPAPRKRYDWDALFKKAKTVKQVVLTRGVDFETEANTMRVMALQAAGRRLLAVTTRVHDGKYLTISLNPIPSTDSVTEMAPSEES